MPSEFNGAATAESPVALDLNGYTDLPGGKLAAIVTYLEMLPPAAQQRGRDRVDVELMHIRAPSIEAYRTLYRHIGTEWIWIDRLRISDAELEAKICASSTEVYFARQGNTDIGLLELDFVDRANVELAYFGLTPDAVGNGIGRWLMDQAIKLAFRDETKRFWVHTCTLDHPSALGFYIRSGFRPFKRAIDVFDDPRLDGGLPKTAQSWNPPITPA